MQNEIELKMMLTEANVAPVCLWLNAQAVQTSEKLQLANTYFDTPEQFFANHQMGFRVRSNHNEHEMTLKMKGEIVGGLHVRPEYNLALPTNTPDFKRLVSHFNLPIENADHIAEHLNITFSTDFQRQTWLIDFQQSRIEIALDQGMIKNPDGEERICELEFELKQGNITDLFAFLSQFPLADGMWLSSLSKAQRGYLVGRVDKMAKEIEYLTACLKNASNASEQYRLTQQLADFARLSVQYPQLSGHFTAEFKEIDRLCSLAYLRQNLTQLSQLM